MKENINKINRRNFLRTLGAAGLGAILASEIAKAGPNEPKVVDSNSPEKTKKTEFPPVPRRKLGKTGFDVPSLSLGAMFDIVENQIILRKTLQWGVNYWDTANGYAGGNSEIGIGNFLIKNPQVRKQVFIVSKATSARTVADVEKRLQTSFKRMNTDYIDLYYGVHGLSDPSRLTDELCDWAENAKKRKLIRFFGFSTHGNMAKCLAAAAKLGWIDAIMTSYNFRLMQDPEMQAAVDACHKAGIGLVAMKTQAEGQKVETEKDKELTNNFLKRGFTPGQAKIKIVLEDERISSACVGMSSVAILTSNAAAVLDKTKLTQTEVDSLKQYAKATCSGYCAGCAHICNAALPDTPCVSEVMRYLMYYNSYGDRDMARELFAQLPPSIKAKLPRTDYRAAEASCPQRLPIGKLVAEAVSKLA